MTDKTNAVPMILFLALPALVCICVLIEPLLTLTFACDTH